MDDLKYTPKQKIASIHFNKKQAEIEALQLRLSGVTSFIQNGNNGCYEVLTSELEPEIRRLDATFSDIGTGVYKASTPDWDKGSLWTLYSSEDNDNILISKINNDESEPNLLTASLMVSSSIRGKTTKNLVLLPVGSKIEFLDSSGKFTTGLIDGLDHRSGCYVVTSDSSFTKEYIPFSLTAEENDSTDTTESDDNNSLEETNIDTDLNYDLPTSVSNDCEFDNLENC